MTNTKAELRYAGLMHWFTSPYVHRLIYNSRTGLTEVETLSILAKYQRRTFSEREIEYPNSFRPQSTFQVRHGCLVLQLLANFNRTVVAQFPPSNNLNAGAWTGVLLRC